MKKIFACAAIIFTALFVLASNTNCVKADTASLDSETITPQQAAILNQELESMKSVLLSMKTAYVAPVTETKPAPIAFSQGELNTLSESLIGIKSEIFTLSEEAKSGSMSPERIALFKSALSGLANGLVAVETIIAETPSSKLAPNIAQNENSPQITSFPNNTEITSQEKTATNKGSEKALAESSLGLKNFSRPAVIGTIIGIIILGIGLWIWKRKADTEEIPKTQL